MLVLCLLLGTFSAAQDSSRLQLSAYGEFYYGYDFGRPANGERPFFLYNHKRHNTPALNLALVKAAYRHTRVRATVGLMTGDYARYNLAAEPRPLRTLFEANVGVRLSQKQDLWLDAGVLPSHIGFESAVGASHWTASRSMAADNSPYYETGVKLTATNNRKNVTMSLLLLNGWQHIKRPDGVRRPSFGFQYTYQPTAAFTLNYSNFIGGDKPDSLHAWRIYQNWYAIFSQDAWGWIVGFDLGRDRNPGGNYACWYTPALIVRRCMGKKIQAAIRAEYFSDANNAYLGPAAGPGLRVWGFSANTDYRVGKHLLWRAELRKLSADRQVFAAANNWAVLTTLCLQW